jgi:tetratricopeptide (TPR) repeat protein
MEHLTAFILYLAAYRLAVIAAGVTCIVIGYRLFAIGVVPAAAPDAASQHGDIRAKIAGAGIALRNIPAGTCFALFGAAIISIMIVKGSPEVTMELLDNGASKAAVRGGETAEMQLYSRSALDQLKHGEKAEALSTVQNALKELAAPINDFAWVLLKTNPEPPQAALLAQTAVSIAPREANFLHTLAEIEYHNGDQQQAIRTLERAHRIKPLPLYAKQLETWRK